MEEVVKVTNARIAWAMQRTKSYGSLLRNKELTSKDRARIDL